MANAADVVREHHTTESLDYGQAKGLLVICRSYISKANCQHCCGSPVICPNVLLKPLSIANPCFH